MHIIISLSFLFLFAFFDGSISSLFANSVIFLLGSLYTLRVDRPWRADALKLFSITFCVYIAIAFIWSRLFSNVDYFYVSDPQNYILRFFDSKDFIFNLDKLLLYYTASEGKDILYVESLQAWCGFANVYLGGITVYSMTLLQTLFGVLSCMTLYQIISQYYGKKAFHYTLLFSLCSLFLMYSCLIIRDVIIAYFYIEATRIVLNKFKIKNIFVLVLLIVLSAGIRLQSGAFLLSFLLLYIYQSAQGTKFQNFTRPVLLIAVVFIASLIFSSVFFETQIEEIGMKGERMVERENESGGLINNLLKLPTGLRELAILFFSQMAPFPPHGTFMRATNPLQVLMGIDVIVYEVYWFFISYTVYYLMIFKNGYRILSDKEKYLFLLAISFFIALTTHPDIRRMMPMYPVIYLIYLNFKERIPRRTLKKSHSVLIVSYISLLVVYFSIKGF